MAEKQVVASRRLWKATPERPDWRPTPPIPAPFSVPVADRAFVAAVAPATDDY